VTQKNNKYKQVHKHKVPTGHNNGNSENE